MWIEIPIKSAEIKEDILMKKALKYRHNRKQAFLNKAIQTKKYVFEGAAFYPYWIGQVYTKKERMYVNPKELYYQVVCDAIDDTYIVLRKIPETKKIQSADSTVLPFSLELDDFRNTIIEDAKTSRINKQFIFGSPLCRTEDCKMIYIPGGLICIDDAVKGKKEKYFVNAYTGEAKKCNL